MIQSLQSVVPDGQSLLGYATIFTENQFPAYTTSYPRSLRSSSLFLSSVSDMVLHREGKTAIGRFWKQKFKHKDKKI